jgi:hypothetical protein
MQPALVGPADEELVAAFGLRVVRVLDLDPRGRDAVTLIRPTAPLRDDALQVERTRGAKQVAAPSGEVIDVEQARFDPRHQPAQDPLPLEERPILHVVALDRQHVERVEGRPGAAEEQRIEVAAAIRVETHELAIEHCIMRANAVGDFSRELIPARQDVPAARDEPALMPFDDRERAEAIVLDFVQLVGMVERLGNPDERHGPGKRHGRSAYRTLHVVGVERAAGWELFTLTRHMPIGGQPR